ncbi:MAG: biotin/lipoate--protein ligase family protein [Pseudomonadota bacterium]
MSDLSLPPLLQGHLSPDPRTDAIAAAQNGCDGGTLLWRADAGLDAALVLAPDVPLPKAAQMAPLAAIALRDAIGAIGPAEVPVHLDWANTIYVDGAAAGRIGLTAPPTDADTPPAWIVVHASLALDPDEPLAGLAPQNLLESWSRHLLHRLSSWEEDGPAPLHAELSGASWERETQDPAWIGRDEALGRLRRDGEATILDPLTDLVEIP